MRVVINIVTDLLGEEEVILERRKGDETIGDYPYYWEAISISTLLLYETENGAVAKIVKSSEILSQEDEIIAEFNNKRSELLEVESSGIEYEFDSKSKSTIPYDPDLIRVDPKNFNISFVHELISEGDIDLAPDFQRKFVWKEIEKRSRLIESIMLRIPLPVFYLAQDKSGKFQVIDGLQRLTVISQFINNKFKLKGMEYLKELDGKYFKHEDAMKCIDPKYAKRIAQTQLTFNIIDPQTPIRVKFEIFKRINQGGKPLKPQEIRNCMASPEVREFLNSVSESIEFKQATGGSVNSIRMEDQELILRFFGFYYSEIVGLAELRYLGYMETFLDDTLDKLNSENTHTLINLKETFINSMLNCYHLFGDLAFRKIQTLDIISITRKPFINKSLFVSWAILLSKYAPEDLIRSVPRRFMQLPMAEELENNYEYYDALTTGTNEFKKISTSFKVARNLIKKNLGF